MQLLINTSANDETHIALLEGEAVLCEKKFPAKHRQAELLLVEIERLLALQGLGLSDLDKIIVENRGDSFTALRIGVVTANALGYGLGIPVVERGAEQSQSSAKDQQKYSVIRPAYGSEPNITKKNNKTKPTVD